MDADDEKLLAHVFNDAATSLNSIHNKTLKFVKKVFLKIELTDDLKEIILDGYFRTRDFQIAMYKIDEKNAIQTVIEMEKNPCIAFLNEFGIPSSMQQALQALKSKPKRMQAQYAARWICKNVEKSERHGPSEFYEI